MLANKKRQQWAILLPVLTTYSWSVLDYSLITPKQGTVLEMMHAAGYTYMKVDTGTG
jgi:hypothetical protein